VLVNAAVWVGDARSAELTPSCSARGRVWKRHHRFATDGTWDKLLRVILGSGFLQDGLLFVGCATNGRVEAAVSRGGPARGSVGASKSPPRRCRQRQGPSSGGRARTCGVTT
jgi:hypothetical protein